jgi:hypothetical protein
MKNPQTNLAVVERWGRDGAGNEAFGGSPPNGAGVGSGVDSTFAEGVGKIDVAGEGTVGVAATGGTGEGNTDWVVSGGPEVVHKTLCPGREGFWSEALPEAWAEMLP